MATFTLILRHHQERIHAAQVQARIALEVGTVEPHPNHPNPRHAAGDHRYRIPTIGLNSGALPGTRPDRIREHETPRQP